MSHEGEDTYTDRELWKGMASDEAALDFKCERPLADASRPGWDRSLTDS